jgi:hypothetical protein
MNLFKTLAMVGLVGVGYCTSPSEESHYSMVGRSGDENQIKSALTLLDNKRITNKSMADDYIGLLAGITCSEVQTVATRDLFFNGLKNYFSLDDHKSLDSLSSQYVLMDFLETSLDTQKWDSKSLMELSLFLVQRIAVTSKSIVKLPVQGTVSIGSSKPHIFHVFTDDEITKIRKSDAAFWETVLKNNASSYLIRKMKSILGVIEAKEAKDTPTKTP